MFGRGRGVAIGTPVVQAVVSALLAHGRIRRGYLGVRTQNAELPDLLGVSQRLGALIIGVEPGSAAERAGLLLGDVILGINGQNVEGVDALRSTLRALPADSSAALRVLRGGTVKDLKALLASEG
jgi:serine protease Do/serine protease DegQ